MTKNTDQKNVSTPVEKQDEQAPQKKPFVKPALERQDKLSVVVGTIVF